MPQVTVYSQPSCVQCNATYRWLGKRGIDYDVVNLQEAPEKLEELRALGFAQAPIVQVEGFEPFSGFNPNLLEEQVLGVTREAPKLYKED